MNPIIFLDIDGVLNPISHRNNYSIDFELIQKLAQEKQNDSLLKANIYFVNQVYFGFDKQSCLYLKKLVEEFDAKIVLTSSWRMAYTKEEIQILFELIDIYGAFIDCTEKGIQRIQEIQTYIDTHKINDFIVIDDFNMKQQFGYRCIHTQNKLNEENYLEAKRILTLQEKHEE